MQEKKKYITLHYLSYLCLVFVLLCFFRYCVHRWYVELIFFIAFLVGYFILYRVCGKALQCEDGYSLIQAVDYYRACERANYRGSNKAKDVGILKQTAEHRDFLEEVEPEALKRCYVTGKQADKMVTNPLVRGLWNLRDKTAKRGGKKHV